MSTEKVVALRNNEEAAFIKLARERWPHSQIIGHGQYTVPRIFGDISEVYLFTEIHRAQEYANIVQEVSGTRVEVVDLSLENQACPQKKS